MTLVPDEPGDIVVSLDSEPEIGLNNAVYQEFMKVVVHVDEQGGWDQSTGQPIEIMPLTRPYGMEAGFVFTGQLLNQGEPVANATIEIEEFLNFVPEVSALPPEPLITKVVKTDMNGIFSYSLPNAGWWIIASTLDDAGTTTIDGQEYNLSGLGALWLHIEEPVDISPSTSVKLWNQN